MAFKNSPKRVGYAASELFRPCPAVTLPPTARILTGWPAGKRSNKHVEMLIKATGMGECRADCSHIEPTLLTVPWGTGQLKVGVA